MVAFEMTTQEVTVGLSLPDIALCRLDGEKIHQLTFDLSIIHRWRAPMNVTSVNQGAQATILINLFNDLGVVDVELGSFDQ